MMLSSQTAMKRGICRNGHEKHYRGECRICKYLCSRKQQIKKRKSVLVEIHATAIPRSQIPTERMRFPRGAMQSIMKRLGFMDRDQALKVRLHGLSFQYRSHMCSLKDADGEKMYVQFKVQNGYLYLWRN